MVPQNKMNPRLKKFLLYASTITLSFVAFAQTAHGAVDVLGGDYVPLTPLPTSFFPKYDLISYLRGLYRFSIAAAGVVAVVRIVYGGFLYVLSDSMGTKSEGKEVIQSALIGLILVLLSWLLLFTINPALVTFKLLILPENGLNVQTPAAPANQGILGSPNSGSPTNNITNGQPIIQA
jgi:hypothetical protein